MSDPETFEALVQWYRPAPPNPPALVATLDTRQVSFATGMAFDAFGNLYVTVFDWQTVTKFDTQRNRTGTFESKYDRIPESIPFDVAENAYVGQPRDVKAPGGTKNILTFDAAETFLARFNVATEARGSDWIGRTPSGYTLLCTSEGATVKQFNVATNTQLRDFNGVPLPGLRAYALALLAIEGLLVVDTNRIVRLDALGTKIHEYGVGLGDVLALWFGLSLDPDGTSIWTANQGSAKVCGFDIAIGTQLLPAPIKTGTGPFSVNGVAVYGSPVRKGQGCRDPNAAAR